MEQHGEPGGGYRLIQRINAFVVDIERLILGVEFHSVKPEGLYLPDDSAEIGGKRIDRAEAAQSGHGVLHLCGPVVYCLVLAFFCSYRHDDRKIDAGLLRRSRKTGCGAVMAVRKVACRGEFGYRALGKRIGKAMSVEIDYFHIMR